MLPTPFQGGLTPDQAADILGVSHPFLLRLLDENKIPSQRIATHRYIAVEALEHYRKQEEQRQLEVMEELQNQAQELNMGY